MSFDRALCAGGTCRTTIDGVSLYRDHAHLSITGSQWLARRMGWAGWVEAHAR